MARGNARWEFGSEGGGGRPFPPDPPHLLTICAILAIVYIAFIGLVVCTYQTARKCSLTCPFAQIIKNQLDYASWPLAVLM